MKTRVRSTAWSLRRGIDLLAVLTVVLLLGAILAGALALDRLAESRTRLIDEIDPGLTAAQTLTTALLNQETGIRGYLITGRRSFLEPYELGRSEQAQAVAELERFGAVVNTRSGEDLARVLEIAGQWQRLAESWIAPDAPPVGADAVGASETAFDQVRQVLDAQRLSFTEQRNRARAELDKASGLLQTMAITIAVLLVLLFAALYLGFRRTVARPLLRLAADVRAVTDEDLNREIVPSGPRELVDLGSDVEDMRRRIVAELAELQRAREELERSNSDLEQFAYVASHDLQEPLRKVASFCQLLQRRYQGQLDERGDQYIEFAVDGARRMQALINDLLAFSRVGRKGGESVEADTGELLAQAIRNVEVVVEETGASITHGPLPVVRCEPTLLTGVFQNLLSNGLKFRGEATPEIHVEAELEGEMQVFSVTDNGIGIEADYAERIFAIFQRLHAKSAYPGTGIGLALSRKIVEHHGGRIWLDTDTPPGRTTFRFSLPALENAAPAAESETP